MSSATRTISSSSSQTITSPKLSHARRAISAVGRMASRRSISAIVSRASFSLVVSSTAGLSGPCSAWR